MNEEKMKELVGCLRDLAYAFSIEVESLGHKRMEEEADRICDRLDTLLIEVEKGSETDGKPLREEGQGTGHRERGEVAGGVVGTEAAETSD